MKVQKAQRRGEIDFNWLKGSHYYSFGGYYNPLQLNLGPLYAVSEYHLEKLEQFEKQELVNCTTYTLVLSGQIRIVNPAKEENKLILKAGQVGNFQALQKLQENEIQQLKKEMANAQEEQEKLKQKVEDAQNFNEFQKEQRELRRADEKREYEEIMNISDKFVIQVQNVSESEIAHFIQIQVFGENVVDEEINVQGLSNKLYTSNISDSLQQGLKQEKEQEQEQEQKQEQEQEQVQKKNSQVVLSDPNAVQVFKNHLVLYSALQQDEHQIFEAKKLENERELAGLFLAVIQGSIKIEYNGQQQLFEQGDSLEANLSKGSLKIIGVKDQSQILSVLVDTKNHEQFKQTLL